MKSTFLAALLRRLRRDQQGVALVEMALSLPLLMLLCLGMIDVSRLITTKIDLEQAAQRTTDYVLARRPTSNNTAEYVAEARSASGLAADKVAVTLYLECGGVRQGSFNNECADDVTVARFAKVVITNDVETQFNWGGMAAMFDGQQRSATVKVVGDSTVRFQ